MAERFPVLEGAEPFCFEGGEIGILVIHGFTGTTQSMRYLGEQYMKAGYTVCGPRLKGHGTHYEDMERTSYIDWIDSVEAGYRWLQERCKKIVVTGLSMGGTLTLYMAAKYKEISAIIPINAAINLVQMEQINTLTEPRFRDGIGSDIKAEGVEELAYAKTPLKSLKELIKLKKETNAKLADIHCPALVCVSEVDHVVPPEDSEFIYAQISSNVKKKLLLPNSYHVATLDNDKALIFKESLAFIKNEVENKPR